MEKSDFAILHGSSIQASPSPRLRMHSKYENGIPD